MFCSRSTELCLSLTMMYLDIFSDQLYVVSLLVTYNHSGFCGFCVNDCWMLEMPTDKTLPTGPHWAFQLPHPPDLFSGASRSGLLLAECPLQSYRVTSYHSAVHCMSSLPLCTLLSLLLGMCRIDFFYFGSVFEKKNIQTWSRLLMSWVQRLELFTTYIIVG